MITIGTCSNCNGPVTVPEFWGGPIPPVPQCTDCGAKSACPYGPKIPMEKPPSKAQEDIVETLKRQGRIK